MPGLSEATEAAPCELLEWDSEHFGFPIARIECDTLTARTAEAIDDWCSDHGIRCLYFMADPDDAETARIAASHGFRVVDVHATVRRSMAGLDSIAATGPGALVVREATDGDLDYLRQLAARSHYGSRFYFDGSFPRERCDALYRNWVERAFRDPDRTLLVPVLDAKPAGYLALAPLSPQRESRGELVAVDERYRGKGVGTDLHVAGYRYLADRGSVRHRGVVSYRNVAVIRLHERLGFITERLEVCHHKWYGGSGID